MSLPWLEKLESRLTFANIVLTDAFLVDYNDNVMASVDKGESFYIEADFNTKNLPSNASYKVSYTVDGVTLSTGNLTYGAGDSGTESWYTYLGNWFASPGQHTVTVIVDPDQSVVETSYADNTKTFNFTPITAPDLPQKFINPLGGVPFQNWGMVNYVDVDPTSNEADFNGGDYSYDGHAGHDMTLANFSFQDRGVPDYAAAAGTVVDVQDGNYDRNTNPGNGAEANYVEIDHGSGWHTFYYHMRTDSVFVHVGDHVVAGQILGLVGSSGYSTLTHLHFEVEHNSNTVEPEYDPGTFWANPPPYQNTVRSVVDSGLAPTGSGLTISDMDQEERPIAAPTYTQAAGQRTFVWFELFNAANDNVAVKFYKPDGSVYPGLGTSFTASEGRNNYYHLNTALPTNMDLGTWHVGIEINGVEKARNSFKVAATGTGACHLAQGTTDVVNGRTTPIDFGSVNVSSSSQLTFTVNNLGTAALNLSNLVLPAGFTLIDSLPASIAASSSATFTLALFTGVSKTYGGLVQFNTTDPNAPTYSFAVKGTVNGGNTGALHGQVFHDLDNNAIENNLDAGLSGWTVSLLNPANNNVIATTTTGNNGLYSFLNLAPATYRVRETLPSGYLQSNANPADIAVTTTDLLVTPFGIITSPVLTSAVSRLTHGDVQLPLTGNSAIESRRVSSGWNLVLNFDKPINQVASVVIAPSATTAIAGTPTFSGNSMIVPVSVTDFTKYDGQALTLTATNVHSTDGGVLATTAVTVRLLRGDINGDGTVNISDINLTKAVSGLPMTLANFRRDINDDGNFNISDINLVKAVSGNSAAGGPTGDTAPTLSAVGDQSVQQSHSTSPIPFTIGDAETDPGSLFVSASSNNQTLVPDATSFLFAGSGVSRTLTITPSAGLTGSAVITVLVSDGQTSTRITFTLTVTA